MKTLKKAYDFLQGNNNKLGSALAGIVVVILIGIVVNSNAFFNLSNFLSIGEQAVTRGLISCGMFMVLLSGTIDLSVAMLYALLGYFFLYFSDIFPVPVALLLGFGIACLHGFINATLIVKAHFHQWVVTIAMQLLLQGILYICTNGYTYTPEVKKPFLVALGSHKIFGVINLRLFTFVAVYIVFVLLFKYRKNFRDMYSVGGNAEAARMMGINIYRTRIRAHVLCSCLVALAALLNCTRSMSAIPLAGSGYEMYAIAGCVLGGVTLGGGRGNVAGAFIGTWLIAIINSIFNIQTFFSTFWYQIVVGALIIIVAVLQSLEQFRMSFIRSRKHAKRREANKVVS